MTLNEEKNTKNAMNDVIKEITEERHEQNWHNNCERDICKKKLQIWYEPMKAHVNSGIEIDPQVLLWTLI